MKRIVTGLALVMVVGCLTAVRTYGGEEAQDARVRKGKLWYETYCTPCHSAGGAPGSALFTGTKKPVDLRTYAQRNGGKFPSMLWWDITFGLEPGNAHTKVWERIRSEQDEPQDGETERSRELNRTIAARGVVGNIEMYVKSIQKESK
jgi:hypothetical protein